MTENPDWQAYRFVNFTKHGRGRSAAWHWASNFLCDVGAPLLHLHTAPDFFIRFEDLSLVLHAHGERHLIPVTMLTSDSLIHAKNMISTRQSAVIDSFREAVLARVQVDTAATNDGPTVH